MAAPPLARPVRELSLSLSLSPPPPRPSLCPHPRAPRWLRRRGSARRRGPAQGGDAAGAWLCRVLSLMWQRPRAVPARVNIAKKPSAHCICRVALLCFAAAFPHACRWATAGLLAVIETQGHGLALQEERDALKQLKSASSLRCLAFPGLAVGSASSDNMPAGGAAGRAQLKRAPSWQPCKMSSGAATASTGWHSKSTHSRAYNAARWGQAQVEALRQRCEARRETAEAQLLARTRSREKQEKLVAARTKLTQLKANNPTSVHHDRAGRLKRSERLLAVRLSVMCHATRCKRTGACNAYFFCRIAGAARVARTATQQREEAEADQRSNLRRKSRGVKLLNKPMTPQTCSIAEQRALLCDLKRQRELRKKAEDDLQIVA